MLKSTSMKKKGTPFDVEILVFNIQKDERWNFKK